MDLDYSNILIKDTIKELFFKVNDMDKVSNFTKMDLHIKANITKVNARETANILILTGQRLMVSG